MPEKSKIMSFPATCAAEMTLIQRISAGSAPYLCGSHRLPPGPLTPNQLLTKNDSASYPYGRIYAEIALKYRLVNYMEMEARNTICIFIVRAVPANAASVR